MTARHLAIMTAAGAVTFLAILVLVFALGQTFGQRCTAAGLQEDDWSACVNRLANGGRP